MNSDTQTILDSIRRQEAALALPTFSKDIAWQIGFIARGLAAARQLSIGIEICAAGAPVFLTALDGTSPNTMRWLRRKSNTVALFDRSSYGLSIQLAAQNQTIARHALPDAEFTSDGGGFPLRAASAGLVGSIAISGLDQRGDHELAVEALCLHLGLDYDTFALPLA
jgi:uncharacterized protein (UPF0303 family)